MNFAKFYPSQTEVVMYLVSAKVEGHTVERLTFDKSQAHIIQKDLFECYGNVSLWEMSQAEVDAKIEAER